MILYSFGIAMIALEYLPDDHERVRQFFRRKGAYSRYKDLLDKRGLLEKWQVLPLLTSALGFLNVMLPTKL